ncbi:unnamed protein product [Owenia fusiformis]|uniref:Uncharacterized protein n=1 Tax=Owenia fusiformis TaxID=6347 RepID=A0A8J1UA22_OWEFU|nr:unnamed protein product [Owenia fusiformis]
MSMGFDLLSKVKLLPVIIQLNSPVRTCYLLLTGVLTYIGIKQIYSILTVKPCGKLAKVHKPKRTNCIDCMAGQELHHMGTEHTREEDKSMDDTMNDVIDFTKKDEFSDITLIVEDQKLHVHKSYLAQWSPVFKKMFVNDQKSKEISLNGKKRVEVLELLHCIYPTQNIISESNVRFLLPLADEYQIKKITQRCEDFLLATTLTVEGLLLAQQYKLKNLRKACINQLRKNTLSDLKTDKLYPQLKMETRIMILEERCTLLESTMLTIDDVCSSRDDSARCKDHEAEDDKVNWQCTKCARIMTEKTQSMCSGVIHTMVQKRKKEYEANTKEPEY